MTKPETKKKSVLPFISIAAVLIGLGLVLYLPNLVEKDNQAPALKLTHPDCSLNNGECVAKQDQQEIALEIKSETIRSATPMLFEVTLNNIKANQVMLDLKGKEMFMGLNQVMLEPVSGDPNRWQGEVTLAVCTTGEMVWVSSVVLEKDGKKTQADFEFTAR
jgi:hypothetical protein